MPDDRFAWADNSLGEFVIYVQDPEAMFDEDGRPRNVDYIEKGEGENINLTIRPRTARHRGTVVFLSFLTVQELDELKELIDTAFEWARPICTIRDKNSREASEKDREATDPRIYRRVPQLFYRKRPEPRDSEGLLIGPERAFDLVKESVDSANEARTHSDAVAEPVPEDTQASNYPPPPNLNEVLGEMGRPSTDS